MLPANKVKAIPGTIVKAITQTIFHVIRTMINVIDILYQLY